MRRKSGFSKSLRNDFSKSVVHDLALPHLDDRELVIETVKAIRNVEVAPHVLPNLAVVGKLPCGVGSAKSTPSQSRYPPTKTRVLDNSATCLKSQAPNEDPPVG